MSILRGDFEIDTPIDHNFHQLEGEKLQRWEASLPPVYWEYRRKWESYPREHILGAVPIHLDIEATNACNLRCVMCPRTDLINSGAFWPIQHFDFALYTRLIDEAVPLGLCSIKYNYLGEPTLHPRLIEMIRYAKQAGVIDVMFNTNATRLTDELARELITSGLDKLFFSFDSPYAEQYNAIRVGADYDTVLEKIKRFHAIRAELHSLTPFTRVSMVRMKDNEHDCDAFRALFAPIVDAVAFVDYLQHGGQHNAERMVVPLGSRQRTFCCPQLWQRMFIHPDGVVTVCCVDSLRDYQVGNIHTQTLQQIWQGEPYQRLRDLHVAGRFEEVAMCANCPLAHY